MEGEGGEGTMLSGKLNRLRSKRKRESISDLRVCVCVGSDTEGVCSMGSGSGTVRDIIGIG